MAGSILENHKGVHPSQVAITVSGAFGFINEHVGYGIRMGDVLVVPAHVLRDAARAKSRIFLESHKGCKEEMPVDVAVWSQKVSDVAYLFLTNDVWSRLQTSKARVPRTHKAAPIAYCSGNGKTSVGSVKVSNTPFLMNYTGSTIPGMSGAPYTVARDDGIVLAMHLGGAVHANMGVSSHLLMAETHFLTKQMKLKPESATSLKKTVTPKVKPQRRKILVKESAMMQEVFIDNYLDRYGRRWDMKQLDLDDFDDGGVESWAYVNEPVDYNAQLNFDDRDDGHEEYDDMDSTDYGDDYDGDYDDFERRRGKRGKEKFSEEELDNFERKHGVKYYATDDEYDSESKKTKTITLKIDNQSAGASGSSEHESQDIRVLSLLERVDLLERRVAALEGARMPGKAPEPKPKQCPYCEELLPSIAAAARHRVKEHPQQTAAARMKSAAGKKVVVPNVVMESAIPNDFKAKVATTGKPAHFQRSSRSQTRRSSVSSSPVSDKERGSRSQPESLSSTQPGDEKTLRLFAELAKAILGRDLDIKLK
ncbi:hypothetical protein 1 [Teucrium fruticans sobemo-like virus]|nr:hypothetical protein 1 [Teucrium fruticans sobemo-like virus]